MSVQSPVTTPLVVAPGRNVVLTRSQSYVGTIACYNASVEKVNSATNSIARLKCKKVFRLLKRDQYLLHTTLVLYIVVNSGANPTIFKFRTTTPAL
jgi:hypothetical protein